MTKQLVLRIPLDESQTTPDLTNAQLAFVTQQVIDTTGELSDFLERLAERGIMASEMDDFVATVEDAS